MTYLHPIAAVPNNLITDTALSYTTKRVVFVLLLSAGRKGRYVTVSFAALSRLCKCCTTTAQKAVKELCAQGYLLKSNRYHFGEKQNHLIYASNRYLWLRREGGYTLVSRDIFGTESSAVSASSGAAQVYEQSPVHYYLFSRNQLPSEGSPKNEKPLSINQITRDYTERKRAGAAVQNSSFHTSWGRVWPLSPYYFDGTGVRVSAGDELEEVE